MTEKEKEGNPTYLTTGGYLKVLDYKEAWKIALSKCSKDIIKEIKSLRNFNSKLFFEITGVKI